MATVVKVEFESWAETTELFKQISNDFGEKTQVTSCVARYVINENRVEKRVP